MDIKPPKSRQRPQYVPLSSVTPPPIINHVDETLPLPTATFSPPEPFTTSKQPRRCSKVIVVVISIVVVLLATVSAITGWYFYSLQPRDASASLQTVTIEQGMTPRAIAQLLDNKDIIRHWLAFELYTKLNGHADTLQAGNYKLGAQQSVEEIVDHLRKGVNDVYNVMIPPGLTLKQLADPTVKNSLAAQGFSSEEIVAAFAADYVSPLLSDRPEGASLEGYIFPETYQLRVGDSLESLIQRSFDELYSRLQTGNLLTKFTERGVTLHQAITLASIVQKEVSDPADQPQVAQVFLKRLGQGMMLGSDVTFIYAANQAGVTPTIDIDSPYNTRRYTGLPPGPIATMNFSALEAVAQPASGEYLYFVAGDDGVTYFSNTYEEHEAAVAAHCHVLCSQY